MKKIDLAQSITILANLGVIAGIVFLAVELRQNNALLEAEAGYNLARNRVANSELLRSSPEFAALLVKLEQGQPLSAQDQLQARGFYVSFIVNWSWEYNEYLEGRISESQLPSQVWGDLLRGEGPLPTPGLMAAWEEQKPYYDSRFVEFVEDELIPSR